MNIRNFTFDTIARAASRKAALLGLGFEVTRTFRGLRLIAKYIGDSRTISHREYQQLMIDGCLQMHQWDPLGMGVRFTYVDIAVAEDLTEETPDALLQCMDNMLTRLEKLPLDATFVKLTKKWAARMIRMAKRVHAPRTLKMPIPAPILNVPETAVG